MTIEHNHFYYGHGMSIGSGTNDGVNAIRVNDLTIDGADNGIRIKSDRSRGGLVQDISYENVCMRDVTNPIVLTPLYTTFQGNKLPIYRDIVLKDVHVTTKGTFTFFGLDAQHKLGVTLDNVTIDDRHASEIRAENAEITVGPHGSNLIPSGDGVSVHGAGSNTGAPLNCENRFVPFAKIPTAPAAWIKIPPEDKTLYVAADGTGDYYSIQRAIEVAPPEGAVISVAPGTYREVLEISKNNLQLRGARPDASKTVIVFDKSSGTAGGTMKSATVNVRGDNFYAENLTFANDFNTTHPQLSQGSQALALLVTGDRAVFRNIRFLGNQDTLYAANKSCSGPNGEPCIPARQYFSHCYIAGNVDFIFGDGKAVFDDCEIHSTPHSEGFVTAQGKHYPTQDSIFVFNHCKLTADPGVTGVWLGRPWRPYASVVFLNTEMGDHITPAGWREWHPGETHYLNTVFYAEYASSGPGAHTDQRDPHTKHLSKQEAARYERKDFLEGSDHWDPSATH
jgi:pectin methylesterase-like acyl-CoA thioesterase